MLPLMMPLYTSKLSASGALAKAVMERIAEKRVSTFLYICGRFSTLQTGRRLCSLSATLPMRVNWGVITLYFRQRLISIAKGEGIDWVGYNIS